VNLARIEATITTTSDWSVVQISRGHLSISQDVSRPADVQLFATANGWSIRAPGGVSRTVVVRGVFEEPTGAPTFRITVSKGVIGRTLLQIRNTSATPFIAASLGNVDKLGSSFRSVQWRTRAGFFGTKAPSLAHADGARRVLAFYYGWYSPEGYDDPRLADRPTDPISSQSYDGILALTRMARTGGIDGFIVSYDGSSPTLLGDALRAGEAEGNVVSPLLELTAATAPGDTGGATKPAVVLDWLRTVLGDSSSTAFLRSGGDPVVFVFQMSRIGLPGWTKILDALSLEGLHVRLVGDAPLSTYGSVEWGVYSYGSPYTLDPKELAIGERATMLESRLLTSPFDGGPHLNAATVAPGYDDHILRGDANPVVERGATGERYLATWQAALMADPDWVLVTSWNEWFESTAVQPSEKYGDLALRQTATQSERFRTQGG
jgi:hypothetical protein